MNKIIIPNQKIFITERWWKMPKMSNSIPNINLVMYLISVLKRVNQRFLIAGHFVWYRIFHKTLVTKSEQVTQQWWGTFSCIKGRSYEGQKQTVLSPVTTSWKCWNWCWLFRTNHSNKNLLLFLLSFTSDIIFCIAINNISPCC